MLIFDDYFAGLMRRVYSVGVRGKKVNELLGRAAKKQQQRQPARKNDMCKPFQHLNLRLICSKLGMNLYQKKVILGMMFVMAFSGRSQAQRLSDHNAIGWYGIFNTTHITKHISLLLEYQWRRDEVITEWQQSLLRTGVQYQFHNGVSVAAGYGYIITYPYGDYPAGPYTVPEHRIYEQLSWGDTKGRLSLTHRIRLEQRYMGKIDQKATEREVNGWNYLNRVRYQLKATLPLNRKKMEDKTLYVSAFDEVFVGFGKNVNQNIFDQNRISGLLGYQFSKILKLEVGYINQIVQQGGLVSGREVFQYNNGLVVNIHLTTR